MKGAVMETVRSPQDQRFVSGLRKVAKVSEIWESSPRQGRLKPAPWACGVDEDRQRDRGV